MSSTPFKENSAKHDCANIQSKVEVRKIGHEFCVLFFNSIAVARLQLVKYFAAEPLQRRWSGGYLWDACGVLTPVHWSHIYITVYAG